MFHLSLVEVTKQFGQTRAVDGISFGVAQGERLALLGPSGCGKTTTLNMIAGFIPADDGKILVRDKDVSSVPAHKRKMGMVFQNYALFPHLSVFRNVAFGLEMSGIDRENTNRRVQEALTTVQLERVGDRFPRQLSGGQQQRVALARALVIRPDILLLDEPLSNLDAKLRQQMRVELVQILRNVGITSIFVTHDQAEALVLADRVAIMNEGRIEQIGSPRAVYEEPGTAFVAKFLGDTNVMRGTVVEVNRSGVTCAIEPGIHVHSPYPLTYSVGDMVEIFIRAERLKVAKNASMELQSYTGILEQIIYLGSDIQYIVRLGPHRLSAIDKNRGQKENFAAEQTVHVEWWPSDVFISPLTIGSNHTLSDD